MQNKMLLTGTNTTEKNNYKKKFNLPVKRHMYLLILNTKIKSRFMLLRHIKKSNTN